MKELQPPNSNVLLGQKFQASGEIVAKVLSSD